MVYTFHTTSILLTTFLFNAPYISPCLWLIPATGVYIDARHIVIHALPTCHYTSEQSDPQNNDPYKPATSQQRLVPSMTQITFQALATTTKVHIQDPHITL